LSGELILDLKASAWNSEGVLSTYNLHASCRRTWYKHERRFQYLRTFGRRERWRGRETTSKRCATSRTMLTFRKRVRSASTVISVFSEWPESLGPPALPKALPWLEERVETKEKERLREKHSHPYVFVHLFIAPSTCPRDADALTLWRSWIVSKLLPTLPPKTPRASWSRTFHCVPT